MRINSINFMKKQRIILIQTQIFWELNLKYKYKNFTENTNCP
jgi:hypothetical protein